MIFKGSRVLLILAVLILLGMFSLRVASSWTGPEGTPLAPAPALTIAHLPPTPSASTYVSGRVLVRLQADTTQIGDVLSRSVFSQWGMEVERVIRPLGVYVLRVPPGHELEAVELLRQDARVRYAEPDYIYHMHTTRPNDTYYLPYQWQLPHIGAETAWDTTTGNTDVTVAVLDTGVDLGHPELATKLVAGYDFINDDANPDDDQGHGTHVAGIIAAVSNNGDGIAGVSWGARIMPVKVLNDKGSGSTSVIASGVTWAADHGADVINMSLGGEGASSTLEDAVTYAYNADVLVVASSGNSYEEGNPVNYPAAYDHVLAVAATDDQDRHASYSSSGSYVDVAAPGGDPSSNSDQTPEHWIIGTYPRFTGSSYAWLAGTSQAAPHVSGLAALLLSVDDTLTPDELTDIIESTAVDVETPGWDELTGYGRIDMAAALAAALTTPTPDTTATFTPSPTPSSTPTVENTWTPTPSPTPTATPSATNPSTATPSPTPTPTPPPDTTPSPTFTPTTTSTPATSPTPTRYPGGDDEVNHATTGVQEAPAVAVSSQGNVVVVWHDGNPASQSIVESMWVPFGAAWTADKWLGDARGGNAILVAPAIAVGPADKAAVVWYHTQDGDSDIYIARGNARTNTWNPPVQVNDDPPQPGQQRSPDVAIGPDGTTYVVWTDNRRGNADIFWSYKKPGESAWRPAMPVQGGTGPGVQGHPAIAVDAQNRVYILWVDRAQGQLRLARFDMASQQWGLITTVGNGLPTGAAPATPTLVVETGRVHVLWQDMRNAQRGPDIYHSVFVNGNWTPPKRVNSDPGNAIQASPAAATTPDGIVAVWEDARDTIKAIYMAWWTPDSGWIGERRVGSDEGTNVQIQPRVATDGEGNAFVVWTDSRGGMSATDIYFRYVPYSTRYQIHLAWLSATTVTK